MRLYNSDEQAAMVLNLSTQRYNPLYDENELQVSRTVDAFVQNSNNLHFIFRDFIEH